MSLKFTDLSPAGRIYIAAVIGLGAGVIMRSVASLILQPVDSTWVILAGLTLLTGSFSIKIPSVAARISVSEAFVIAGLLAFGPHAATLIVALDSLVLTSWLRGPSRSSLRALFNMTAGALAISCSAQLLGWMLPVYPAASAPSDQLLFPVFALAISYFMINSWLIAIAVGIERSESAVAIWLRHFPWLSLNYPGFPIWLWYFCPSDPSPCLDLRGFRMRHPARMDDTQWVNYKPSPFSSRSTDF
jgi:hypothetical protein